MKDINKGSFGCALGVSIMLGAMGICGVVFWKCFSVAYNSAQYHGNVVESIAAAFYRDVFPLYLVAGLIFLAGLWIAINATISILKSFFDI